MKDYLKAYGTRKISKFQMGGGMPAGDPGMSQPAMEGQGQAQAGPDLQGMLMEYSQTRDPQMAVAICDTLVEQLGLQGGAPAGAQPMPAAGDGMSKMAYYNQGGNLNSNARMSYRQPKFKKGGKLIG
jgi:hypothetical protein